MSNKRKRYDSAYKLEICKSVDSGLATVAELSRETGISENTLCIYMAEALSREPRNAICRKRSHIA